MTSPQAFPSPTFEITSLTPTPSPNRPTEIKNPNKFQTMK